MKKCTFIGNLTDDVKLEQVSVKEDGKEAKRSVTEITIACNEKNKEKDAAFVTFTVWGIMAENLAKFNKKGSKLYIEADIANNNYEKDGVKHYGYKFTATDIEYLSSKKES